MSTASQVRETVVALMAFMGGETQGEVAEGLQLNQSQVSRKLSGVSVFSLDDLDNLAAHYGIAVHDLVQGPEHACTVLRERMLAITNKERT